MMNYYNSEPILEASNKGGFKSALASILGKTKSTIGLAMFMILTLCQFSWAQSTANYAFTTNTTSSLALDLNGNAIDMSAGTTQLVAAGLDDTASTLTNLNLGSGAAFTFNLMGSPYTQFGVSDNGVLTLGALTATSTYTIGSSTTPTIGAFANDMRVGSDGKVETKVFGTAPNRTIVVQWTNNMIRYLSSAVAGTATFQVRLYETSNRIEFVYGAMATNTSTPTVYNVGFSNNTTANNIVSINTTTNTSSTSATATTNSYTASSNVTALHSTANGSRRAYVFTPFFGNPNAPITFSASAVTASTTTVNWIDNSTNEGYFTVGRSTSPTGPFTIVGTVLSTSAAGTGNAYSLIQTSLSPTTTYYYEVKALNEGGGTSTALTGSQVTAGSLTYYWVGTTGGLYNLAANWNTAADGTGSPRTVADSTDTLIVDGNGTTPGGATTISINVASFSIGQFKVTSNTTCSLESDSTTTRTITLTGSAGEDFTVEAGSTLNLTNATNAVAFAFTNDGNTGTIAGTYNAAAVNGNRITTTGGTNTVVTVAATGVVNNSIVDNSGCLTGSVATLVFANGSNYTHSSFTTGNAYIPNATWGATANATITGGTTSTGLTSASPSLGNLTINTTTLTATLSAFGANTRIIQGNLTILATGTGRFRAVTSGSLTVNGNIIVTGGILDSANAATGIVIANGTTTVNTGTTLDLNSGIFQQNGSTFTNNGTLTGTAATSILNFVSATDAPQTFAGTGTVLTNIGGLGINNGGNLTITHTNTIPTLRVNLTKGTIVNSNKITMGTGAALAVATQIGLAAATVPGGSFDVSPIWNLGTGAYNISYLQESVTRTTGFEVAPTRIAASVTVNNTNGLTIAGGDLTATTTLTLTNGIVTTGANTLIVGNATTVGTLTGGSATAYVNGTLTRSIANANTNTTFVTYPIGKTGVYTPIALAPATTSIALFKAESFGSNTGTSNPSITALSTTRRFEALPVSGTFTNINVRLSDAGIVTGNIPVQAPSATGAYSSAFGSTATFAAGPPITVTSTTPVTTANYTGYLSYAVSNACSGTPAPGLTTATSSTICFGSSTTLGITTIPTGSGVTYQWQSSTDNVTYSNIASATNSTYTVTPTVATWYQVIVTCSAGPASATSTPKQITFTNNVTAITPGAVCGQGTATLGATPSTGATIYWYAAATGGTPLNSGNTFVTPSLTASTNYYAAAEVVAPSFTLGTATDLTAVTEELTAFNNYRANFKFQTIYTAAELQTLGLTAGNITSLAFNVNSLGSAATNANYTIKIGTTSSTSFTGTTYLTPAFSTVYGPVTYTHTASGFQTMIFTTPYNWDGTSNLVFEITQDGIDSSANALTYYTATPSNQVLYNFNNNAATGGTASLKRFNVIFNGQNICASPRSLVTATVSSPPTLTLSANAATICAGQTSAPINVTVGASDYQNYTFSPTAGVTGTAGTGFSFNPTVTTTYTLTATQTSGSLCTTTRTIVVTVNEVPSAITIAPANSTSCANSILPITATGGAATILSFNENANVLPTTFTISNTSGTGTATLDNTYFQSGTGAVRFNTTSTSADVQYALNSNVDLTGSSAAKITFSHIAAMEGYLTSFDYGSVEYSTDGGTTWVVFSPADYVGTAATAVFNATSARFSTKSYADWTSQFIGSTSVPTTGTALWKTETFNIPAAALTSTQFKFRFKYTTDTSTNYYGWLIDNIKIEKLSSTITWSPVTNLYSDALATVPYTGAPATTVYHKATTATAATVYTATATSPATCTTTATTSITVNAATAAPTASAQTFCNSATVANLTATGTGIQWYAAATGGAPLASTVALTSTNYFATQTVSGCESPRTQVAVVVNVTTAPTASAQTFCNSATVANLTATGTGIQWYADPTGGVALASTVALTSTNYFATQTVSGCESPRTQVAVVVNVTTAPTATAQTFCNSATVANLTATGTGIQWYADPTGGAPLASTVALTSTNYFATQTVSGCESPRTQVAVTINTTAAPTATSPQTFTAPATIANIVVTGTTGTVIWYPTSADAIANTNPLATSTTLVNNTTYYVTQTIAGCRSTPVGVLVTVTLKNNSFDMSSLNYYPNPVIDLVTISYSEAISSIEVYNLVGQMVKTIQPNATTTQLDMSNLPTATYLVKVTSEGKTANIKIVKK